MASDVNVRVEIRATDLARACCLADGTGEQVTEITDRIANAASNMSAGYTSGRWHDHETGETRGPTAAQYGRNVEKGDYSYRGIVYTANYAAQKDNHENNTLLKAVH